MSALKTPAADAPAAEWGALAASIPGWRGPQFSLVLPGYWDPDTGHPVPDPDHWAWEGWLWRLAGRPEVMVERGGERVRIWDGSPEAIQQQLSGTGRTKGRALIAYAAANGRWPGGER